MSKDKEGPFIDHETVLRGILAPHLVSQRASDRDERLASFLRLSHPIRVDALLKAFGEDRMLSEVYDHLHGLVGELDPEKFIKATQRTVFSKLVTGFVASTYSRTDLEVLSGHETRSFLKDVGEGDRASSPSNLLINKEDGNIAGAISSLLIPSPSSVSRHGVELRSILHSLSAICISDPKIVIVSPQTDVDGLFRHSGIEFKKLPLQVNDIVSISKALLHFSPSKTKPPLITLLPKSGPTRR